MTFDLSTISNLQALAPTLLPAIKTGLPVVSSLVILEGLLSVDNALVLAAMVKHLPEKEAKLALKAGLLGAYIGRGAMLFSASYIIHNPWLKLLGGSYLIWLMVSSLAGGAEGEEAEEGEDSGESKSRKVKGGFWATVLAVELADLAFSVDNVAAAVAMSDQLWAVLTGVAIGILAMRFVAGVFVGLIEKFPILEQIAYLLVGWIGILLVLEQQGIYEAGEVAKFLSILFIIAGGMAYSQFAPVQTALRPAVNFVGVLFAFVHSLVAGLFTGSFKLVAGLAQPVVSLYPGFKKVPAHGAENAQVQDTKSGGDRN
ncbi:MAG: DUF475 domain-containing protein [Candidatus Melainabacteria bacterium]|nr:DUF475 domain-containing protein [Candidatus Melainabacteria bacterium]